MRLYRTAAVVAISVATSSCGSTTEPEFEEWPEPTETFLRFTSDAGDYIGQGESRDIRYADAEWIATYRGTPDPQEISISVSMPHERWTLDLSNGNLGPLFTGHFAEAERFPFNSSGHPGLQFVGAGRGCNQLTGEFTIGYLELGASNEIRRLHMTFEQHCEGGISALRGEIAVVADPWR